MLFNFVCLLNQLIKQTINQMSTKTLHIDKPSKDLLTFVRALREKKEEDKKKLASMKDMYFSKK